MARPAPELRIGDVPAHLAQPAGSGPWPGVVVIHDASGMTTDLLDQTSWLADAGFLAAAPDLFDGGTLLRCMRQMIRSYSTWEGEVYSRIEAVRSWLAARDDCTGRVGVLGFCMGGGFALALAPGHGFDAASANYGALPKDAERFFAGACPIIGSYGGRDLSLRKAPEKLRRALAAAGVEHEVYEYPEAGHGFLNNHRPGEVPVLMQLMGAAIRTGYHEPSAVEARRRITDFLHRHLAG